MFFGPRYIELRKKIIHKKIVSNIYRLSVLLENVNRSVVIHIENYIRHSKLELNY